MGVVDKTAHAVQRINRLRMRSHRRTGLCGLTRCVTRFTLAVGAGTVAEWN